jgi:hypothetical protein
MDQVVAYGLSEGQRGFSKQWLHRGCVIRNDLGSDLGATLWQYRLWSFLERDKNLKRFLAKNQHKHKKEIIELCKFV